MRFTRGMDIEQYLNEKQRHLSKSSSRIKDYAVFDFNYIPLKPFMREEAKPVIDALLRYKQTGIANNVLILGCRGSGKSVMARYLMKILTKKGGLRFAYVNCREHNTSFKILSALLNLEPRGFSLDELWGRFSEAYKSKTVFILDEVDLISEKDRRKDILYFLSRSPNNYMAVLLSNNPKFINNLDESTRSSLQPEVIHFRSYNAVELRQILIDRAHIGLTSAPAKIINETAAMTVQNTNSDVRVAIKTLYLWAMEPKSPLRATFEKARRDILVDVIKDLNDKNLIILKAAMACADGYVKDVYAAYCRISVEYKEEPFSYMHFYSNLSYLQSLGLIALVSTKIHRTYTNRIQLTFDSGVLETIWKI
ncbi:MAG: orc1/cdc6 family replication initiation protein, partial [Sedimentisphaerales bacterium]|nr:orc1/cdc6 family replication initiation protein [Sedimentisphaerales bacterium]